MDKESLPPDLRNLADDEAKKKDYRTLWSLLQRSGSENQPSFDVEEAWSELSSTLDLNTSAGRADRDPRPSRSREARQTPGARHGVWTTAATSILAVVVVGVLFAWWSRPVTVSTTAGEQATVELPDGSTVALNGASRLQYDRGFHRLPFVAAPTRSVALVGEAYFQVSRGDRPFRVESENAVVQVLGTAFTVRALRADDTPTTNVILETGRVRVEPVSGKTVSGETGSRLRPEAGTRPESGRSVVLDGPGMRARVIGTGPMETPGKIELKYMAAWRTGGFAAQKAPLHSILRDLERQFGTDLRLGEDVNASGTLTLHYTRTVELEDVLRDICVIQGLSYRKTQDGYLLEAS